MPGRFLIVRKDLHLDQVLIESEGLTIGRLLGNDLALNHPTVSRTQAGIKEIEGGFWIFNLSHANGTLVNGELIDKVPLLNGDIIQIGPFSLTVHLHGPDLTLEVEASVDAVHHEAQIASVPEGPVEHKTVILNLKNVKEAQKTAVTQMTMRLSDLTGMTSGQIPGIDEQALRIFWEKRKREAGKLTAETPLQPKGKIRLGKAQFNWRPTFDLQRTWPRGIFLWSTILVAIGSLALAFFYLKAYSPGPLSRAHAATTLSAVPAIATRPNAGSCTTCHEIRETMSESCSACHTTPTFSSAISEAHEKVKLNCLACHDEHHGEDFRPGLVANTACVKCHRDGSGLVSPVTGKPLTTPHGGSLGYPITNGEWTWAGVSERQWQRIGQTGKAGDFSVKDQFHLVHLGGRETGRSNCTDCHVAGFEPNQLRTGVAESCAGCHSMQNQNAGAAATLSGGDAPNCVSCHAQHGHERDAKSSVREAKLTTP